MSLAPICLFAYNRITETEEVVNALKQNNLAKESKLYIFSDGPKNEVDKLKVDEVRRFLGTISGFKNVYINESIKNKGLAKSIIFGVTKVIKEYGYVIVLEDDLITSPNFLDFMNQALIFYQNDEDIMSISGFTWKMKELQNLEEDIYFGLRASSWGWATWQDKWESVDWKVRNFDDFILDKKAVKRFNRGGSDLTRILRKQMEGKIDSWAIRFCFQQFLDNRASVFPTVSKVKNIGFSDQATHTKGLSKFHVDLVNSSENKFRFIKFHTYNINLLKEFEKKFSLTNRFLHKIKRLFF